MQAGEVQLGWREWGRGDVTVVFIHGNLASKDWIELAAPLFPTGLRVVGIEKALEGVTTLEEIWRVTAED